MRIAFIKSGANRRYVLLTVLLLAALYVLVPQLSDFRSSWHLLSHPRWAWVVLAIGLTSLTYLAAAATYYLLAFRLLRYGQTVLVQLAAMAVNRLLPAGIGALGVNFAYLRRHRQSTGQAVSTLAVNNLLGVIGHSLLLIVALALAGGHVAGSFAGPHRNLHTLVSYGVAVLVTAVIAGLLFGRHRLLKAVHEAGRQLAEYRERPQRLVLALATSALLTLCNVLCLWACAQAVGVQSSFVVILIIFSFGVGAGAATPTPGGLGGFEAGLTAGFIAHGVAASPALSAALLYRLISYWLPLPVGLVALVTSQRRKILPT